MKKRLLAMWVRSNKDGAFIEGNQSKNLKYITQKNNYTNLSLLPFKHMLSNIIFIDEKETIGNVGALQNR